MHAYLKALPTVFALSLSIVLAACGGGGGGEGASATAESVNTRTNQSGQPGAPVQTPFTAEVSVSPEDGAALSGMVRLEVRGSKMVNVELLPSDGYLPRHGIFTVSDDGSHAWMDLDTTTLPNGSVALRISAFDVPPGESGATEIIAMPARTWNISNTKEEPAEPFSATVTTAPEDGATVRGITRLEIRGSGIVNAELLPADSYTPRLGVFNVSEDKRHAWLDFDTRSLPDGVRAVRISAFNVPEKQSGAQEIVAMPARSWNFSNGASEAFSAMVSTAPAHGAMLNGMTRLEVRGTGLENVELLPAYGYLPILGTFNISSDKTYAYLDIDTADLPGGTFSARISAFNAPAGVSTAKEIIVMPARQWTTPIANGTPAPGPVSDVQFDGPTEVAADANGNVYVRDREDRRIQQIAPDGSATTLVEEAERITGMAASPGGDIYYAYTLRNSEGSFREDVIRRISSAGGEPVDVRLSKNGSRITRGLGGRMAVDPVSGALYLLHTTSTETYIDTSVNRVKPDGTLTELFRVRGPLTDISVYGDAVWAGNVEPRGGVDFYRWDGIGDPEYFSPAAAVSLTGMVAAESGLYFSKYIFGRESGDTDCTVNYLEAASMESSHIAGDPLGPCGYREGNGEAAGFTRPLDIAQGSDGNFYVPDAENHIIRRVTPEGEVSLFAGVPGQQDAD